MKTMNQYEATRYFKELKKDKTNETMIVAEDLSVLEFAMKKKLRANVFAYCPELTYSDVAKRIIAYFTTHSGETIVLSKKLYARIVDKDNAQGLIASFLFPRRKLDQFKEAKKVVVLDGIETPGNVGTIFRTADAVGVDLIIITNEVARVFSPKALRASRGMLLFIPFVVSDFEETSLFLTNNGFNLYLAEPIEGKEYKAYSYDGKVALAFGSERYGIDKRYFTIPHYKVFIPMKGLMTSLNVGVAASIVIYEAFLRR